MLERQFANCGGPAQNRESIVHYEIICESKRNIQETEDIVATEEGPICLSFELVVYTKRHIIL